MTVTAPAEPATDDASIADLPEPAAVRWARDNRLFCAVVGIGLLLRLVVELAYPPALEFFGDSYSYLFYAAHLGDVSLWHPLGYPFFIWLTSFTHSLLALTLLQHLLGVVSALLVYRLVRSLGVGAIGGTVAALPLLLDAYQLDVEQFVLSDTLFTFLVVAAVFAARRVLQQPTAGRAATVGALIAAATLTRTVGLAVAFAVAVALLVRRVPWPFLAAAAATCAIPIGAYMIAFHATYGVYGLQAYSGRYLYGTVAPFARCDPSSLPDAQQGLCPTTPPATRPGSNEYVWGIYPYVTTPGDAVRRSQEAGQFAKHVALTQPGDFAAAVARNVAHYFSPRHDVGPRDWFVGSWQFPTRATSPAWNISPADEGLGGRPEHGHINSGAASWLRGYQRVVFVPGLALLFATLVAITACVVRKRDREARLATALLTSTGLLLLVVPSMSAGFDWRYALPAQALLVPAGVIGWRVCRSAAADGQWRRAAPIVVTLLTLALAAPGVALPSVYAQSALTPHRVAPAPATQRVGSGLDVHLGIPDLIGVRCRWDQGAPHLDGIVAVPAMFTYRSGPASLVQPGNFAVNHGVITSAPAPQVRNPGIPSTMVGPQATSTTGVLYLYTRRTTGTIRYVDPVGRGAAAWSYHVGSPPDQRIGALCTGSSPWAGAQVHSLRITGVAPFTLAATQPVQFGFPRPSKRARDFDLRFRLTSPMGAVGPWQYPPTWQHTTLQRQALLNLTAGTTYCFSVRARDALNEVTDWTRPTCTTRMYDDASLPPADGWTRTTGNAGFLDGTATTAQTKGAQLSVGGTIGQAGLLVYRCATCGVVEVYADTRLLARLDLHATRPSMAMWTSRRFSAAKALTLRVVSDGKPVVVDAFGLAPPPA